MFSRTQGNHPIDQKIQYLKTVGPKRAAIFNKLGIETVYDLLYYFPRDYEDRSQVKTAFETAHGEKATLIGTVTGVKETKPRPGLVVTKLLLKDSGGFFMGIWFNQPFLKKQFSPGKKVVLTGKIDRATGQVQVYANDFELMEEGEELLQGGRIVPVYPLTEQLSQRLLRRIIKKGLAEWTHRLREFIPPHLVEAHALPVLPEALEEVHFPASIQKAQKAKERFIWEDLFLFQVALGLRRLKLTRINKPHQYLPHPDIVEKFTGKLPFTLTAGQNNAWQEINNDLDKAGPMYRLLQGDVGSGKTVVSLLFLLKAVGSGLQGALMAPTEILAEQHYLGLRRLLGDSGIEIGFISGGLRKKERAVFLERLRAGQISIIVGTHALIQDDVEFKNLAAVVIDEQHRFGVRQRALLQSKGQYPDVLIMTATPIPRTLALTLYGDLEISTIRELPPGRKPVKTYLSTDMGSVYRFVRKQVDLGRQAYIICPLIEESERFDAQAAVELEKELSSGIFFRDCRVALLHGRLKTDEKERIMRSFYSGAVDVLISTTIIEVGVDVPNASVMVILGAERFGLAQLHQLRGRVGRGSEESYCILVSDSPSEDARERLEVLTRVADGFSLAEADLSLRGPGELTGFRQSGLPEFKAADLIRDQRLLLQVRGEAFKLLETDPELMRRDNILLREELQARSMLNWGGG
ncbi:MAG TPA: DNA helicase RecG [Desulfotomaculum sp.]|nr:MAG: ATP-dependent DNA helicase RecG [Desulfotomaculum sp. 46_80]HAG11260.1 DNA helicase RecG [Desulfotomaculum sp.]HBY03847.1 DNA helicase RecG [Desulfotomaculum sp.]